MLIINDVHLGVSRSAGTTPASALALEQYTFDQFSGLLDRAEKVGHGLLLVNGDLFDGFTVPNHVLLFTYEQLASRLRSNRLTHVVLSRGNHDIARDTTKVSSFDLLCALLVSEFGEDSVTVVTTPQTIMLTTGAAAWVIPHAPNQDIFEMWLDAALAEPTPYTFVHANYDNNFATEADHSLNISAERAKQFADAGTTLIFGHEHQQAKQGKALVVGNQFPTSISDCLGNDAKRALYFEDGLLKQLQTWQAAGSYYEVPWSQLDQVPDASQFVRVIGEASADQSSEVLELIGQLRKRHGAFVISNAVKVEGRSLDEEALNAVEQLQTFNILDFLFENLNEKQVAVLKALHGSKDHA